MKQILTQGIVLSRVDYGEANRILTILTPEQGKLSLMARGVRKQGSKLAGGIELFSTTQISYLHGRGAIGTLISARLIRYYENIVKDIDRVQLGYQLIKMLHKATEDQPEAEYFGLLEQSFQALNDQTIDLNLVKVWFQAQLLKQAGHRPNLETTTDNQKLQPDQIYNFDLDDMAFTPHPEGTYVPADIKFLRLIFSANPPATLSKVQGSEGLTQAALPLVQTMLQTHIRL